MKNILCFILIGFIVAKNLILVGDKRFVEIAQNLIGIDEMNQFTYYYSYRYYLSNKEPISYKGFNIQVTGVTSDIFDSIYNDAPKSSLTEQLSKAAKGTNVLLNLGIQNLKEFNNIVNLYGKLADKFTNLNFYIIPILGVNESIERNIKNKDIKEFNMKIENRIKLAEFTNLKYKDILKDYDPTQLILNDEAIDLNNYSSDGIGFFNSGYNKIFQAMVEGL